MRSIHPPAPSLPGLTTEELAIENGILPQSIRVRLCRTGSYFGLRPEKRPNGRLIWPRNWEELINGSTRDAA